MSHESWRNRGGWFSRIPIYSNKFLVSSQRGRLVWTVKPATGASLFRRPSVRLRPEQSWNPRRPAFALIFCVKGMSATHWTVWLTVWMSAEVSNKRIRGIEVIRYTTLTLLSYLTAFLDVIIFGDQINRAVIPTLFGIRSWVEAERRHHNHKFTTAGPHNCFFRVWN